MQLFAPTFHSAHDSDVKEANKQKCQQPNQQQQQGQTVYHTSAQYLNRTNAQYPQQAPQPVTAPNHLPASYLSHSNANGPQSINTQTISTSLDPKSNIPNRAFQVSMHYTCAAPCFDRWWISKV